MTAQPKKQSKVGTPAAPSSAAMLALLAPAEGAECGGANQACGPRGQPPRLALACAPVIPRGCTGLQPATVGTDAGTAGGLFLAPLIPAVKLSSREDFMTKPRLAFALYRVRRDQKRSIARFAEDRAMSVSCVVRLAIAEFLERREEMAKWKPANGRAGAGQ